MATKKKKSVRQLGDGEIADRLQSILICAATGNRSLADDRQYPTLRRELMRRSLETPSFLLTHPSVESFSASIKGLADRRERVDRVRNDFAPLFAAAGQADAVEITDSSAWTGEPSRAARLKTVRKLLPLAQTAVESMIATLSEPNPNGAPLLDERREAIDHLRALHKTLGQLLAAIDAGHFDDELGQSLAAQAARYGKRFARAVRDDPMPYLTSALLLGIFEACGMPGIAGYLTGVALNVRKHVPEKR